MIEESKLFQKVVEIINGEFPENDTEIARETVAEDVIGWDSMAHVSLIAMIEEAFSVRFSGAEIVTFENVGGLFDVLKEKLSKK
ncbi:acyl carrier protein (plasmid) [Mesorhizobium sp. AR02]|uniref:acyl carrier protein n=1 Tax=Mesorhizobium sp. AR02 TaxID=2865837 RepID=UPI00215FB18B|nr:acyl carrier protein [Mesorhizobium sp. AR02]UVK50241.1 acyl carrier protein [Mesorhizobium sp. AR02]